MPRMNDAAEPPPRTHARLRWLLWAGFLLLWSAALLTPQPVRAAEAMLAEEARFPASKLLHVAAYAVAALLTAWLPLPPRYRWLLLLALAAHAFATEYLQQFVRARYPSLRDVALDHAGLLLGVLLTWKRWRAWASTPHA